MTRLSGMVLLLALFGAVQGSAQGFDGSWDLVPGKSTDIAPWGNSLLQVGIHTSDGCIHVVHNWLERGKVAYADTLGFCPGGGEVASTIRSEVWPDNWYMGVLSAVGETRFVSGLWLKEGRSFRVTTRETVRTSQGKSPLTTISDYTLGADGNAMSVTVKRSSRPTPVNLVFERKGPPR